MSSEKGASPGTDVDDGRRFIHVRGWEKYQDYIRQGNPWIKSYVGLLHHRQFQPLGWHLRGLLFSLWLEYASAPHGEPQEALGLPADVRRLNRMLGMTAYQRYLDELEARGWIFYSEHERLKDALAKPTQSGLGADAEPTQSRPEPESQKSAQTRMAKPSFFLPETEREGDTETEEQVSTSSSSESQLDETGGYWRCPRCFQIYAEKQERGLCPNMGCGEPLVVMHFGEAA